MMESLQQLYAKSLDMLSHEIEAYWDEDNLWLKEGQVNNSAGTLCLHLCGNLQHFIGATLGNTGYVRNRTAEFEMQMTREELLLEIQLTKSVVETTLANLSVETTQKFYPLEVFGFPMTVSYFLIHLHGHLNYHLGQITYHRRLLDHQ